MIVKARRTEATRATHTTLITATDKWMSGWGAATGGASKVAYCCRPEDSDAVYDWVKSDDNMTNVNCHGADWRPAKAAHVSYYVVSPGHMALVR